MLQLELVKLLLLLYRHVDVRRAPMVILELQLIACHASSAAQSDSASAWVTSGRVEDAAGAKNQRCGRRLYAFIPNPLTLLLWNGGSM